MENHDLGHFLLEWTSLVFLSACRLHFKLVSTLRKFVNILSQLATLMTLKPLLIIPSLDMWLTPACTDSDVVRRGKQGHHLRRKSCRCLPTLTCWLILTAYYFLPIHYNSKCLGRVILFCSGMHTNFKIKDAADVRVCEHTVRWCWLQLLVNETFDKLYVNEKDAGIS